MPSAASRVVSPDNKNNPGLRDYVLEPHVTMATGHDTLKHEMGCSVMTVN
jgi:hypothetical protein